MRNVKPSELIFVSLFPLDFLPVAMATGMHLDTTIREDTRPVHSIQDTEQGEVDITEDPNLQLEEPAESLLEVEVEVDMARGSSGSLDESTSRCVQIT